MRKLEQDQAPVCLLGDTEQNTVPAKEWILQQFPHMNITDVEILDNCTGELDNLINEINAKTQEVVVSLLPSPMQEHFFLDYREKLSASLWYGAGPVRPAQKRSRIVSFFRERKRVRALTAFMVKFEKQEAAQYEQ
jgi:N-acetylglucosaminyldiphosphoundecaprenol N-acetyl-beta-D-mannosaminyltransferase